MAWDWGLLLSRWCVWGGVGAGGWGVGVGVVAAFAAFFTLALLRLIAAHLPWSIHQCPQVWFSGPSADGSSGVASDGGYQPGPTGTLSSAAGVPAPAVPPSSISAPASVPTPASSSSATTGTGSFMVLQWCPLYPRCFPDGFLTDGVGMSIAPIPPTHTSCMFVAGLSLLRHPPSTPLHQPFRQLPPY